MTTVQQIYEEMQRIAPLALAESWDNPGLLVDCGGEVSRVLVTLDITPRWWKRPPGRAAGSSCPTTRSSSRPSKS